LQPFGKILSKPTHSGMTGKTRLFPPIVGGKQGSSIPCMESRGPFEANAPRKPTGDLLTEERIARREKLGAMIDAHMAPLG
jgi:hypothetical protein